VAVAQLVLEYLKVALSVQVVAGIVTLVLFKRFAVDIRALLARIAHIKLPGGAEVSTPQLERVTDKNLPPKGVPDLPADATPTLPEGIHLTPDQAGAVAEAFRAERARAYLWEYRYLNYFLAAGTQRVLDWLAGLKERTTYGMYDSWWLPIFPNANERRAIIDALQAHHLITMEGELITVTPKGHEYLGWRGPLPAPAG